MIFLFLFVDLLLFFINHHLFLLCRNLSADVTRFVPSTLRVKREDARKPNRMKTFTQESTARPTESNNAASKDDAYIQFMSEMQGLL